MYNEYIISMHISLFNLELTMEELLVFASEFHSCIHEYIYGNEGLKHANYKELGRHTFTVLEYAKSVWTNVPVLWVKKMSIFNT